MLTELVTSPFIPNDTNMGLEAGRIQVTWSLAPKSMCDLPVCQPPLWTCLSWQGCLAAAWISIDVGVWYAATEMEGRQLL